MEKDKTRFWLKLADTFELPEEILVDFPCIFTVGTQKFYVLNHKGLLEYQNRKIGLRMKGGKIVLEGKNFLIEEIDREQIIVSGNITLISFGGGEI